jgi:asparagine synthase (glutamine-hydrolysing)
MCGIAALVSPSGIDGCVIRRMMDVARHRGPDDEGYLCVGDGAEDPHAWGGPSTPAVAYQCGAPFAPLGPLTDDPGPVTLALGHRRLSIVDLSVFGHQPMCTPDRRYWIVYNGEIYNYRELATELASLGYVFTSHCDTEVILAAYARWGLSCLSRFNGMFAFVIYDAQAGELIVARDRFGIKPLYYWFAPDGTLAVVSEIKQLTAVPGWAPRVNTARAAEFLATGVTDHTDETLFADVHQVLPGHCAHVPLSALRPGLSSRLVLQRWYELRPARFDGTFEDAANECRTLLADSVRLMLRADVPVGSCLSGGIDSSSIVMLMNRQLNAEGAGALQKTFTAASDVAASDERRWVDEVTRAISVDARSVTPDFDGLQASSAAMAWHQDEPFSSTSIFAQWSVFALAATSGLRVMLDGQGADEAFAGYHSFFSPYLANLVRSGQMRRAWAELSAIADRHGYRRTTAIAGIARVLAPTADPQFASIERFSHAQLTSSNLPMLLRYEDRNSMAHSVEARVPFLDHRLVEFALGLPDAFKIGAGVTKRVLRAAMSGILPDPIRDRVDKIAFETPEAYWMKGPHHNWFRSEIATAVEISNRFVPSSTLIRFDATVAGTRPYDREAWRAISFGQWMHAFGVAAPSSRQ